MNPQFVVTYILFAGMGNGSWDYYSMLIAYSSPIGSTGMKKD